MGLKTRATMLILGICMIILPLLKLNIYNNYGVFYTTEAGTFGFILIGACTILSALVSRKAVRLPIRQIQVVYVDPNKNIIERGVYLTEEEKNILSPLFNKQASPHLGIDEDEHIETALEITARNNVILYFLKEEPQYAKVGKYLFAVKLNEHESEVLYKIIKKYERNVYD